MSSDSRRCGCRILCTSAGTSEKHFPISESTVPRQLLKTDVEGCLGTSRAGSPPQDRGLLRRVLKRSCAMLRLVLQAAFSLKLKVLLRWHVHPLVQQALKNRARWSGPHGYAVKRGFICSISVELNRLSPLTSPSHWRCHLPLQARGVDAPSRSCPCIYVP